MSRERRIAIVAGILFILGTVTGSGSVLVLDPLYEDPDILAEVATDENRVVTGALLILGMAVSLSSMAVVLYPLLRRFNPTLAIGYIVFRGALEGFCYLVSLLGTLFLIPLSAAYIDAGSPSDGQFRALADVLVNGEEVAAVLTIVFILGAVMFYWILWESRLVPRWLSGWGLLATVPYVIAGLLVMFGEIEHFSAADALPRMPLAVQEMVLALWLVVRGFNRDVIKTER